VDGRRRDLFRPVDLVDVLVYVVVLNLAIQFVPSVISETFTVSLLTAILLKIVLELVVAAKGVVLSRLRAASTHRGRAVAAGALWVLALGSKLLVLWVVDLVFGDRVSLGGFLPVTALIITLVICRALTRRYLVPASSGQ
jgi:hypothetical protein